jgi:hypothetical protein
MLYEATEIQGWWNISPSPLALSGPPYAKTAIGLGFFSIPKFICQKIILTKLL